MIMSTIARIVRRPTPEAIAAIVKNVFFAPLAASMIACGDIGKEVGSDISDPAPVFPVDPGSVAPVEGVPGSDGVWVDPGVVPLDVPPLEPLVVPPLSTGVAVPGVVVPGVTVPPP